jgi:aminoglycoside phosphotransferase (APT) family kinase protein
MQTFFGLKICCIPVPVGTVYWYCVTDDMDLDLDRAFQIVRFERGITAQKFIDRSLILQIRIRVFSSPCHRLKLPDF